MSDIVKEIDEDYANVGRYAVRREDAQFFYDKLAKAWPQLRARIVAAEGVCKADQMLDRCPDQDTQQREFWQLKRQKALEVWRALAGQAERAAE